MGFQGSAEEICPRDGREGSAIVDSLGNRSFNGRATHFVSWCWDYSLWIVVSGLSHWAASGTVDISATYFWMCFFCNNQRQMLLESAMCADSTLLCDVFGRRLSKIGHMIILMDTYE